MVNSLEHYADASNLILPTHWLTHCQTLLSDVQQYQEWAIALHESTAAFSHHSLADGLHITAQRLQTLLNVDRCVIFQFTDSPIQPVVLVSDAQDHQTPHTALNNVGYDHYRSQLDQGVVVFLPRGDRRSVMSKSGQTEPDCLPSTAGEIVIVPLLHQGTCLGGISLEWTNTTRRWTDDETAVVQMVASSCAMALHEAKLNQQLKAEQWQRQQLDAELQSLQASKGNGATVEDTLAWKALRRSAATNRALLEAIPDLIIWMNREGTYLDFISAKHFKAVMPYSNMCGRNIYDIMPHDIAQQRMTYVEQALNTGETQVYEYHLLIDRTLCTEEARIAAIGQDEVLIIIRDISDRKRAEMALRESEARFQQLASASFEGLAVSEAGIVLEVNDSFLHLFGYTRTEAIGMHARQFHPPEEQDAVLERLNAADEQPYEAVCLHRDGTLFICEIRGKMVPYQGRIVRVTAFRDITLRKRDAATLQALNQELELRVEQRTAALQASEAALRHRIERERLMVAIAQHIRQSLHLTDILSTTVAEVRRFLQADRSLVYRFHPDWSGDVVTESVATGVLSISGRHLIDLGLGDIVSRAQHGQIVTIDDIYAHNLLPEQVEFLSQLQIRAKLIVPILQAQPQGGTKLWGLLIAHCCHVCREWQSWEAELLQQLATQVAIAIQQSELYERVKVSLDEKELLLKELHHRVKNNMQVISSIFSLQSRCVKDPHILSLLTDSKNRIYSMALIHEKLYQSNNLGNLDFADYVHKLTNALLSSYNVDRTLVKLYLTVVDISFNLDTAIPCGLLINELVSNSLKHAFPNNKMGEIHVDLAIMADQQLCLVVKDDGVGLPELLRLHQLDSLGLRLIRALTRQLSGALTMFNDNGAVFQVTFPIPELS